MEALLSPSAPAARPRVARAAGVGGERGRGSRATTSDALWHGPSRRNGPAQSLKTSASKTVNFRQSQNDASTIPAARSENHRRHAPSLHLRREITTRPASSAEMPSRWERRRQRRTKNVAKVRQTAAPPPRTPCRPCGPNGSRMAGRVAGMGVQQGQQHPTFRPVTPWPSRGPVTLGLPRSSPGPSRRTPRRAQRDVAGRRQAYLLYPHHAALRRRAAWTPSARPKPPAPPIPSRPQPESPSHGSTNAKEVCPVRRAARRARCGDLRCPAGPAAGLG